MAENRPADAVMTDPWNEPIGVRTADTIYTGGREAMIIASLDFVSSLDMGLVNSKMKMRVVDC